MVFGRLTVTKRDGVDSYGKATWICSCECGGTTSVCGKLLRSGNTKSCGCLQREQGHLKWMDLTGKKFSRLTVIKFIGFLGKQKRSTWLCRCDCGNTSKVDTATLRSGSTKSCGCYCRERIRETHTTHGETRNGIRTKEYRCWKSMKDRCYLKSCECFYRYGGRGIKVCKRWKNSFENFLKDMGRCPKGLTIERIGNGGNYCKSNCCWGTKKQQARNRRTNVYATHNGIKLCALDWSIKLGIPYWSVIRRLKDGYSIARIIRRYGCI